ncbi:MAG: GNAT family N-acetyltransferase [Chloroflexi bacterium]|nr:GNAT family N-acetyltransferase [Chloroflexota bacterium]
MADIQIRDAVKQDAAEVVRLVRVLADDDDETSEVSEEFVHEYLVYPGCGILLAQESKDVLGLLSYSVRPNLYHAGNCCLIEELVVDATARSRGIGGMLVSAIMEKAGKAGCAEISVSTMPDNGGAIRFYRKHGFGDEAVYLERHF